MGLMIVCIYTFIVFVTKFLDSTWYGPGFPAGPCLGEGGCDGGPLGL